MNHYSMNGERCLFVAMVNGDRWIRAEGSNEERVFAELERAADASR